MSSLIQIASVVSLLISANAFVAPFQKTYRSPFVARQVLFSETPVDAVEPSVDAAEPAVDAVEEAPEAAVVAEEAAVAEEAPVAEEAVVAEESAPAPEPEEEKKRNTLFVGNLPFDMTDADVRDIFSAHGTVELVSVPRDRESGQARGFAFVDMANEEELQTCIDAVHGNMVGGRSIRVQVSLPKGEVKKKAPANAGKKKLYVGNLSFETTVEDVRELFSQFGEVSDVYMPLDSNTGEQRGFAFVTLDEAGMEEAIEKTNGEELQGRNLVVSVPLPPGQKTKRGGGQNRMKMYIGNLSFYTVADTLRELFEEFGEVHDCYLPEDVSTGGSRGFGFVTMDPDAAQRAIDETDGCELDGRIIRVNEAQPKKARNEDADFEDGDY